LQEDIPITEDIAIVTGFQDAVSVRLGGDYLVADWLRVSAGAHYETSAVPAARQGVAVVDGNKWGVAAGATFFAGKHLAFDVAFAEQFLSNRNITDSELRQIALQADVLNPDNTTVGEGKVVGNGEFASRLTFVGIGATVYLGAPSEDARSAR
jgi:long-subunit fatty acid transport protein